MESNPSPKTIHHDGNMTDKNGEAIGFFSLPRELRDKIYDLVWEEHKQVCDDVVFTFRAAIPRVRFICRQFKSEYDQASPAKSLVNVDDKFGMLSGLMKPPRLATQSTHFEASIWMLENCQHPLLNLWNNGLCYCMSSLRSELGRKLDLLRHLRLVKQVHIRLYLHSTHHLKAFVDELTTCPILSGVTVNSSKSFDPSTDDLTFAIWSRERGSLLDNTDERKASEVVEAAHQRRKKRDEGEAQGEAAGTSLSRKLDEEGSEGEEVDEDNGEGSPIPISS